MTVALTVEDRLDIEHTVAGYAHILNNQDLDALHLVFTSDAVLETVGVATPLKGLAEISGALSGQPIADHMTVNSHIRPDGDHARVWSMFLVVTEEGRAVNGDYLDVVLRTDAGWRISHRTVVRRYLREAQEANTAAYADWLLSNRGFPARG